ncbi:hypothetical protein K2173_011484 [Erythroxylum novogranatense]|uniref:S-adenosylmethionine-dependent methyltransferase n=1 Tax=Erythroxylum novogranatense TaxID=1862640 RepID=A0AAV8S661_9ROSI|nr:hypothetical protein K2173_011484 [Erythroxylum novogranatense]
MEDGEIKETSRSCAMFGGEGPSSYAMNSSPQRGFLEAAQEIMKMSIVENLETEKLSSATYRIADFGCSCGHNAILAIQTILEAVRHKIQLEGCELPEFQVFFNDLVGNDFNTFFALLPPQRQYYASGVPGTFHGRLFPEKSLHFAYSSCALNWLSKVPELVTDKASPAWNNGKIYHLGAHKEVAEAYGAKFCKDMESFLNARSEELVEGGLMAIIMPGLPDAVPLSQTDTALLFQLLESCIIGVAKQGLASMEKVDTFNLPVHFPSAGELEKVVKRQGKYSIETLEVLSNPNELTKASLQQAPSNLRAVFDRIISSHFGNEFSKKLFDEYSKRIADPSFLSISHLCQLSVFLLVLKRINHCKR